MNKDSFIGNDGQGLTMATEGNDNKINETMDLASPGSNQISPSPGKGANDYSMLEESIYYENTVVFDETMNSSRSIGGATNQ
jgi:hypothetical protein